MMTIPSLRSLIRQTVWPLLHDAVDRLQALESRFSAWRSDDVPPTAPPALRGSVLLAGLTGDPVVFADSGDRIAEGIAGDAINAQIADRDQTITRLFARSSPLDGQSLVVRLLVSTDGGATYSRAAAVTIADSSRSAEATVLAKINKDDLYIFAVENTEAAAYSGPLAVVAA